MLKTIGRRIRDGELIEGSLIKIPIAGEMRYFIKQEFSGPGADEVDPNSVVDIVVRDIEKPTTHKTKVKCATERDSNIQKPPKGADHHGNQ